VEVKSELSEGSVLLLVAFLLVNAPNCHLTHNIYFKIFIHTSMNIIFKIIICLLVNSGGSRPGVWRGN